MRRMLNGGDRITPESLRALAADKGSPFWEGWARQALLWAADTLEAAQTVIDERQPRRDSGGQS